ncbi:hypothetical protein [Endozoicomonas sp. ONNA1]|uniref:hypothetical protein n=1 Tax=Endozoicomonas sp. ONNA1 TaxID=2828740 RepID=UPI002148B9EC|nr:hypothetical protein [Endozoicomonas sp. ONNA1]
MYVMMEKTLSTMFLFLLLPLSVICQAEIVTRRFVVELLQNQDTASPDQVFSTKRDLNTLSGSSLDIDNTNDFTGPDFPADDNLHGFNGYGLATTFIKSISWQLLYATPLLVAYELALTTHEAPPGSKPYSWLPGEALIAVGWLLKSYWNPNSLLFSPMDQPEGSQDHPFAITTSGLSEQGEQDNGPPNQPPASSDQQASGTTTQSTGFFTNPLNYGSDDGNEDPQQQQHTFALNCFVHPCHGVCRFRPPSASGGLDEADEECPICTEMFRNGIVTPCCSKRIDTHCLRRAFLSTPGSSTKTCPFCREDLSWLAQSPAFSVSEEAQQGLADPFHEPPGNSSSQTDPFVFASGQRICEAPIMGEDGQIRPCGVLCPSAKDLSYHNFIMHTKQRICGETATGVNGWERQCKRVFRNSKALAKHKAKYHRERRASDVRSQYENL